MKWILIVLIMFCTVSTAFAEMVEVPREALIKLRDYIEELQVAYNALVDELNVKDAALDSAYQEISRLRKRSSGLWLGASTGYPFPSATAHGMYIINNSIGIMMNGGYATKPYIQAGMMVRVGK